MNNLISTKDDEIWDPSLEYQTYIRPKDGSRGKYAPQTVFEYMYKCCLVISDVSAWRGFEPRIHGNRDIVAEYKRTHACERCGIRSDNPMKFVFFELHLTKNDRISAMVHWASPSQLEYELSTRGMYCRRCSRLIVKEVTENIPAPAVIPDSTQL